MAKNQKSDNRNNQGRWTRTFSMAAVAILLFSGWAWWHFVRSNPERTFFAAIENSLRTQGMSLKVVQENGGQKLEQNVQLGFGQQNVAHGFTTISQEGQVSASIKTETISTPQAEYVRYAAIDTDQKDTSGKQLDFSQLLNLWGKSDSNSGQAGDLYNEAVLGVVPAGNLSAADRVALMQLIRDNGVYKLDDIEHTRVAGRPVYVYDVTVAPQEYVEMLKQFGRSAGLTQLESVNPANYKNADPLKFRMRVDVWGRYLTGVEYTDGGRTETFGSYGVANNVTAPKDTIPVEELQSRLQAIAQ